MQTSPLWALHLSVLLRSEGSLAESWFSSFFFFFPILKMSAELLNETLLNKGRLASFQILTEMRLRNIFSIEPWTMSSKSKTIVHGMINTYKAFKFFQTNSTAGKILIWYSYCNFRNLSKFWKQFTDVWIWAELLWFKLLPPQWNPWQKDWWWDSRFPRAHR